MRKRFKQKLHSCGLCKPHKVGWVSRWDARGLAMLKIFEKEKRAVVEG